MNATQTDYVKARALYETLRAVNPDSDDTWQAFELMHAAGDRVIAMAEFVMKSTTPDRYEQVAIFFSDKAKRNPANRQRLIDICMRLDTQAEVTI